MLACVLFVCSGCKLDDFLFNTKKLTSYSVSNAVIPDSARQFVSLSSHGTTIYGFFIKSPRSAPPTILYCHGNKESIEPYWDRAEILYQAGFNVFIFDYEGFGMSGGECSEEALYADGQAALNYLRSRRDVWETRIIYYGFSLGTAVAIDLAANVRPPEALICEAPFASGETLLQSGVLLDIPGSIALKGEYNNAAKIHNVHVPFLLLHGTDDRFIDMAKNGQVVFDNANEPKQFIRVPGAGHSTIPWTMGVSTYQKTLWDYIARLSQIIG
jgi:alpha-beta hydrolase superfamily lysophospholipase